MLAKVNEEKLKGTIIIIQETLFESYWLVSCIGTPKKPAMQQSIELVRYKVVQGVRRSYNLSNHQNMLFYIFVVISCILLTNAMFIIWFGVNFFAKEPVDKDLESSNLFLAKVLLTSNSSMGSHTIWSLQSNFVHDNEQQACKQCHKLTLVNNHVLGY